MDDGGEPNSEGMIADGGEPNSEGMVADGGGRRMEDGGACGQLLISIGGCMRLEYIQHMSTLTAVFDPNPDGTVHLPLPAELRTRKLKIFAIMTPIESGEEIPQKGAAGGFGCLKGKIHAAADFDAPLADFRNYME